MEISAALTVVTQSVVYILSEADETPAVGHVEAACWARGTTLLLTRLQVLAVRRVEVLEDAVAVARCILNNQTIIIMCSPWLV